MIAKHGGVTGNVVESEQQNHVAAFNGDATAELVHFPALYSTISSMCFISLYIR
jgi:hypothetical protein